MLEAIADIDLRAIVTKIVEKGGDLVAAKLIFDRLAPAPKSRTVGIEAFSALTAQSSNQLLAARSRRRRRLN
jgi:hypothetical protein